jgi:signal transduction histidine kinase
MAAVSIGLGWFMAGRVLRPLRTMTAAARQISEDSLHERLAVHGPKDELKDLGDTIDGLLDRLDSAFDAQRQFVANASHELRTPLTLARTLLQITLTDPDATIETFRSTCEEVLAAGEQQEQLIEVLLTLARSQRGLANREVVDLAIVADDVLRAHQSGAARRGLTVDVSLVRAPVLGDVQLLKRLVSNLVENAQQYNVPDGRLAVRVELKSSQPVLRVTNSGPPVPADHVERLLLPFQRLGVQRAGPHSGLGLGLSVVAAIARAHHAALRATPGPDGGLDISVAFPPLPDPA